MNAILRRKFWKAGFFNNSDAPSSAETLTEENLQVEHKVEAVEEKIIDTEIVEELKPKSKKLKKVVDTEE